MPWRPPTCQEEQRPYGKRLKISYSLYIWLYPVDTIKAFAFSTIPCQLPFHSYSHIVSTIIHPSGMSVTSTKVPAATNPSNFILITSMHTSE